MDIRAVFGCNLRRLRQAAELSQEAVAERLGADRAYVSLIERGQQNITLETIWHVARAMGVHPMLFFDDREDALRWSSLPGAPPPGVGG